MYPSDYGYSIGIQNESIYKISATYKKNSWVHNLEDKYYEWTISPEAEFSDVNGVGVWDIYHDGFLQSNSTSYTENIFGVRPTFYLKADVLYSKGDGSIENPYRICL